MDRNLQTKEAHMKTAKRVILALHEYLLARGLMGFAP